MDDFLSPLLGDSSNGQQSYGDSESSYAFFDHSLLETLFYDEMMADSSFPSHDSTSARDDANANSLFSAEGFMCEQANEGVFAPINSLNNVAGDQEQPMVSSQPAEYSTRQVTHPSQFAEPIAAHYQYSPMLATMPVAAAASTGQYVALNHNTIVTAPVQPPTISASTTSMNYAQIEALQAEYRKGLAAAAVLAQREHHQQHHRQQQQQQLQAGTVANSNNARPLLKTRSSGDAITEAYANNTTSQHHTYEQLQQPPIPQNTALMQQQLWVAKGDSSTTTTNTAPQLVVNNNNSSNNNDIKTVEAKKLVSQFAFLAEKLGITLPQNVLASLTTAAVLHGEQQLHSSSSLSSTTSEQQRHTTTNNNNNAVFPTTFSAAPMQQHKPPIHVAVFPEKNTSYSYSSPAPILSSASKTFQDATSAAVQPVEQEGKASFASSSPDSSSNNNKPSSEVAGDGGKVVVKGETFENAVCGADGTMEYFQNSSNHKVGEQDAAIFVGSGVAADEEAATPQSSTASNRKRKRPRIEECEAKLAALKDENRILKRHLDAVLKKTKTADLERAQAERDMREMVQEQNIGLIDEDKLQKLVMRFTEMYSDYGKSRQQELRFHLEQLRKLATPTTFTKMSLWTLGQNDRFFHHPKKNSLGDILRVELQITPTQVKKIVERRQRIHSLTANIKQALDLLEKLRILCEWKQQIFHSRMSKCQEVLTPLQVVKLLIWVDDNSETLERVCPGWGSERIQATPKRSDNTSASHTAKEVVGATAIIIEDTAAHCTAATTRKDSESTGDSSLW